MTCPIRYVVLDPAFATTADAEAAAELAAARPRPACRRCRRPLAGGVCRDCDRRPYGDQRWKVPRPG